MNDVVVRLSQLETDSNLLKDKMDKMNDIQEKISNSMSLMAASQENVANTLEKVNDTMERFRDFEVRTEAERKNERDHRDRLDRRVDGLQRDITDSRREFDGNFDKVYSSIRKIDKTCTSNYNDLDKRLEVKSGVDDVKQANTDNAFNLRGERLWKVLFWFVTFLILVIYGVKG